MFALCMWQISEGDSEAIWVIGANSSSKMINWIRRAKWEVRILSQTQVNRDGKEKKYDFVEGQKRIYF